MFELTQQVDLKSYSGSCGKSEGAKPMANFVIEADNVPAKNVAALFGVEESEVPTLVDSFFQSMTEKNKGRRDKRYVAMGPIPSSYFAKGKHTIAFGNDGAANRTSFLGAITALPLMDGKFTVKFRASVESPSDKLCGFLNRHINRSVRVALVCDPGFQFQFKGSSQAPVDKRDGQGDLKLNPPDEKGAAQLQQAAEGLAKPRGEKDAPPATSSAPKPAKKAAAKAAPKKAAKTGAKRRPAKKGLSIKSAAKKG